MLVKFEIYCIYQHQQQYSKLLSYYLKISFKLFTDNQINSEKFIVYLPELIFQLVIYSKLKPK